MAIKPFLPFYNIKRTSGPRIYGRGGIIFLNFENFLSEVNQGSWAFFRCFISDERRNLPNLNVLFIILHLLLHQITLRLRYLSSILQNNCLCTLEYNENTKWITNYNPFYPPPPSSPCSCVDTPSIIICNTNLRKRWYMGLRWNPNLN